MRPARRPHVLRICSLVWIQRLYHVTSQPRFTTAICSCPRNTILGNPLHSLGALLVWCSQLPSRVPQLLALALALARQKPFPESLVGHDGLGAKSCRLEQP